MIRLIKFLFTGSWHEHKWKRISTIDVYDRDCEKRPVATKYVLQCTDCGNIKRKEI